MKKLPRFNMRIAYDSPNGVHQISGYGNDFEDAKNDLLESIEFFKNEFINNNYATGGYTAFTKDAKYLYDSLDSIIKELEESE